MTLRGTALNLGLCVCLGCGGVSGQAPAPEVVESQPESEVAVEGPSPITPGDEGFRQEVGSAAMVYGLVPHADGWAVALYEEVDDEPLVRIVTAPDWSELGNVPLEMVEFGALRPGLPPTLLLKDDEDEPAIPASTTNLVVQAIPPSWSLETSLLVRREQETRPLTNDEAARCRDRRRSCRGNVIRRSRWHVGEISHGEPSAVPWAWVTGAPPGRLRVAQLGERWHLMQNSRDGDDDALTLGVFDGRRIQTTAQHTLTGPLVAWLAAGQGPVLVEGAPSESGTRLRLIYFDDAGQIVQRVETADVPGNASRAVDAFVCGGTVFVVIAPMQGTQHTIRVFGFDGAGRPVLDRTVYHRDEGGTPATANSRVSRSLVMGCHATKAAVAFVIPGENEPEPDPRESAPEGSGELRLVEWGLP